MHDGYMYLGGSGGVGSGTQSYAVTNWKENSIFFLFIFFHHRLINIPSEFFDLGKPCIYVLFHISHAQQSEANKRRKMRSSLILDIYM